MPTPTRGEFGEGPSNLARYGTRFNCVEINSSFHRRHRPATWSGWAESVPGDFRFSVKLPKTITHVARLVDCGALLDTFAAEVAGLGTKLAVVLVQLPPKLTFDAALARGFFALMTSKVPAQLACEPRHSSWFEEGVSETLADLGVARVAADPACVPAAAIPGGASGLAYWRLHGSPRMYRSSYGPQRIEAYAQAITSLPPGTQPWCIFDNTASSAATANALELVDALGG